MMEKGVPSVAPVRGRIVVSVGAVLLKAPISEVMRLNPR